MSIGRAVFAVFWVTWAVSWGVAARTASPAASRAAGRDVRLYRLTSGIGAALIASQILSELRVLVLVHISPMQELTCALLTGPGFAFAWWARVHLGHLWSAAVTRKAGHFIIKTGPYAFVRHPIYTGLLWSALVSAIAGATVVSLAGFALVAVGFWIKARLEEGFLAAELGTMEYDAYRRRVPMLIPWPRFRP